jgi:hypothetical protein
MPRSTSTKNNGTYVLYRFHRSRDMRENDSPMFCRRAIPLPDAFATRNTRRARGFLLLAARAVAEQNVRPRAQRTTRIHWRQLLARPKLAGHTPAPPLWLGGGGSGGRTNSRRTGTRNTRKATTRARGSSRQHKFCTNSLCGRWSTWGRRFARPAGHVVVIHSRR